MQTPLWHSADKLQDLFVPHLLEHEPPQSMSVSVPFFMPSEHDIAAVPVEAEVDVEVLPTPDPLLALSAPVPELLLFDLAAFIPIKA